MSVLNGTDWQVTVASVSQADLWKYAPSLGITVWWEVCGSRGEKKDHSETPARKQVIQGWKRSHAPLLTTALPLQYIFLSFRPACFVFYCVQWNSFDYFPWETITQQPHSICCQIFFLNFHLISSLLFRQCFIILCISVLSISHANASLKYLLAAFPPHIYIILNFFFSHVSASNSMARGFVGFVYAVVCYPSHHHHPLSCHQWAYGTVMSKKAAAGSHRKDSRWAPVVAVLA